MKKGDLNKKNNKEEKMLLMISEAVINTKGVSKLANRLNENWMKTFINLSQLKNSIRITGDKEINLDIYINIKNDYRIPDVSWDIQKKLKHMLMENNIKIKNINIHVQGIDY